MYDEDRDMLNHIHELAHMTQRLTHILTRQVELLASRIEQIEKQAGIYNPDTAPKGYGL